MSTKTISDPLIDHQLKYCSNPILSLLKAKDEAVPFLEPVDPIALGIPDYAEKIKHPMDLSTIRKKLSSGEYSKPEEFHEDIMLMFNNCYTYNEPGSIVYEMGKKLQKYYDDMWAKLPMEVPKKAKPSTASSPLTSDRPRRAAKSAEEMPMDEYTFCADILTELGKSKHKRYVFPFLEPVQEKDAPSYFDVIKNPMDLSTMRRKLDTRQYSSSQQFISDLELIVENCYKYNPDETEVYKCGKEFEKVVKGMLGKQRDPEERISELRREISRLTGELRELEAQVPSSKRMFSLSDRERIGQTLLGLTRSQAEKVAEIVQRHCAYEYIDNDEIEVNMHTIPDEVIGEINEYITRSAKRVEERAE